MGIIVSDAFTVATTTALAAKVPDVGTSWVLEIDGSAAKLRILSTNDFVTADVAGTDSHLLYTSRPNPGVAEYDVQAATVTPATVAGRPFWLIARYTDSSNYYGAAGYAGIDAADKKIYKKVAGTVTEIASGDTGLAASDVLKFEIRNATKKLYKNGVEQLTTSDNSLTSAGRAGLGVGNLFVATDDIVTGVQIDNYLVTELDAIAASAIAAHVQSGKTGTSRKLATAIGLARAAQSAISGTSTKRTTSTARGRHALDALVGALAAPRLAKGSAKSNALATDTTRRVGVSVPPGLAVHSVVVPDTTSRDASSVPPGLAVHTVETGESIKHSFSAAKGQLKAWAKATKSAQGATSSAAIGGARATAIATDTTGRTPIAIAAARSGAVATDATGRRSAAIGAATGKAQAAPSVAKHVSTASSGGLRAKAVAICTTGHITALAQGSNRTSVDQPVFLSAKATHRLSSVAAIVTTARRTTATIAAATSTVVPTDTTGRISATAIGSAASRATAPQGNLRQNTATSRVRISATAISQAGRRALAKGSARISAALPTFLSIKTSLRLSAVATNLAAARQAAGVAAAKIDAIALDTTARVAQASGAAATKAIAQQANARQSAAVGRLRSAATVICTTGRSTVLARGSSKTSVELPIFLSAKGTHRQSGFATSLPAARQASAIAAARATVAALDTTARASQASGTARAKATAPQGNARQSAAVGRVRSTAAVICTTARTTALARGSSKTSVELPIFLGAKGTLRQSAVATNLAASRQASAIAVARATATALDTTVRVSPSASGAAITKATAAQANARQSAATGRVGVIAIGTTGTTTRSTAVVKGSAKANASQPRFPSAKSAGKQSAVAAATPGRVATAVAAQRSRGAVASGQATRTAPTLYVVAGTDVVVTPGPSHRASTVARGSADIGGSIVSGAAARRSASAAVTLRFSSIGIQIPPEVIWLRGRRDTTQLRGKYGNGSMAGQSTVIALRGRR